VVPRDEVVASGGAGRVELGGLEVEADGDMMLLGVDTLTPTGAEELDPTPGAVTDAEAEAEAAESSTVRCVTEDLLEMHFGQFDDLPTRPVPSLIS
jgi:hypothetical protein